MKTRERIAQAKKSVYSLVTKKRYGKMCITEYTYVLKETLETLLGYLVVVNRIKEPEIKAGMQHYLLLQYVKYAEQYAAQGDSSYLNTKIVSSKGRPSKDFKQKLLKYRSELMEYKTAETDVFKEAENEVEVEAINYVLKLIK